MNIKEIEIKGLKHSYNITISAEDLNKKIEKKLAEVSKSIKMPGFRKGKIPLNILQQRYGVAVRGEVLEDAVNTGTQNLIKEKKLKPAFQPKVDIKSVEEGKDLSFDVELENLPEIQDVDLSKISLTKKIAEVPEEKINEWVKNIAQSHKQTKKLKNTHKSKNGNVVVIDFLGKLDGTPFDGGEGKDHHLELGSNSFIPGFEEQLIGVKEGDKKTITVTFPKEYHAQNLAGKETTFDVTVKEVHEVVDTEINDDTAKKLGMKNLEELKKNVKERLESSYTFQTNTKLKRELLDAFAEKYKFEVPLTLIDMEFNAIWKEFELAKKQGNIDEEDKNKDEKTLQKEYKDLAERRVRLGLLLSDIGQKNKVTVKNEDLQKAIINEAMRYPGQEKKVVEYYKKNKNAMEALKAPIFEEKVVEFIIKNIKLTEQKVSVEELFDEELDTKEEKSKAKKTSKSK